MKKAKLMLTAIGAVAIVGGALAFKASKFVSANVYCSTFSQAPNCRLVQFQTTAVIGAQTKNPCSGGSYFTESGCQTAYATTTNPVYDKQPG